jgi:glucokinase
MAASGIPADCFAPRDSGMFAGVFAGAEMILAGDLGGTKSNLGAFEIERGKLRCVSKKRFASRNFSRAEDIIESFTRELSRKTTAACFDVAGPVANNSIRATNLPWVVEGASLARLLGVARVPLLNDLEATAYGLQVLEPADLETLRPGVADPRANQAVIAAGTGLGEAMILWDGARHIPMASEGGHAGWAPHNELEIDLLRHLHKKFGAVECETLLSGRGFYEIHEFLDPAVHHAGFDNPDADPAPEITRRALDGSCATCVRAVDVWLGIYGAEAGNLALRCVARGGIYVAGGIALKILPKLKEGRFVAAFGEHPKLQSFLAKIPLFVVLNEDAPLLGAAHVASLEARAAP